MRIAVIGSGIAGLTATWRLGEHHEVDLFEARETIGMDDASVEVEVAGRNLRVDVPLRVFGSGYYPNLVELYHEAAIPRGEADYSASYSRLGGPTYFGYRTHQWCNLAISLPELRHGRFTSNLAYYWYGARLFIGENRRLKSGDIGDVTIQDYLRQRGYSRSFTEEVLYPTLCAILTCSVEDAKQYPARSVIEFFTRTFSTPFVRVESNTKSVVDRLSSRANQVHLNTPVQKVESNGIGMTIHTEHDHYNFDHVILATQAHRVLPLIEPSPAEQAAFEVFRMTTFECVVHRDEALCPRDREAWRPINAIVAESGGMPMYTMWMNAIIPGWHNESPLFQTINPLCDINENKVIRRVCLDRPLLTLKTVNAVRDLVQLHKDPGRRLWFCGSYLTEGLPLLESAAVSADAVAETILQRQ